MKKLAAITLAGILSACSTQQVDIPRTKLQGVYVDLEELPEGVIRDVGFELPSLEHCTTFETTLNNIERDNVVPVCEKSKSDPEYFRLCLKAKAIFAKEYYGQYLQSGCKNYH